jgi:hypothetical protein
MEVVVTNAMVSASAFAHFSRHLYNKSKIRVQSLHPSHVDTNRNPSFCLDQNRPSPLLRSFMCMY